MDDINYDQYSLSDLLSARAGIDAEAFPERAATLDKLITQKQASTDSSSSGTHVSAKVLRSSGVKFHGSAGEYFSIWIVNLLLTIVTLGIYSAWATVRSKQYFYANTEIDGHRFSYLAQPLQILKGRIIGVLLFAMYFLASAFSPIASVVIVLVLLIATPFIVCMSLRFRMRMTAYRNVRFNFKGSVSEAFGLFVLLPIVALFSLYLALPWTFKKVDEFIYSNISFGDKKMISSLRTGEYYVASLGAIMIAILLFVLASIGFGFSMSSLVGEDGKPEFSFAYIMFIVGYFGVFVASSSFYTAYVRNHVFANTQIEEVASFASSLSFTQLLWLRGSNFVALILTLGFAAPWTKVRTAKLYAQVTQVNILEGADSVVASSNETASAVGDEVSNAFDIDVAIG